MIRLLLLAAAFGGLGVYVSRLLETRRRERLAVLRASFLLGKRERPERAAVLKEVALRSGAVRFRLPRQWSEEYPREDEAAFGDPGDPQRVLRLNSSTSAATAGGALPLLRARVGPDASRIEELGDGRALLRAVEASRDGGRDVVVFRWLLAAPTAPRTLRLASFALSVPERNAFDPLTRDVLATLDEEIGSARLA